MCTSITCKVAPWLGPQDRQVHVGLPAVDDGVGLLAGALRRLLVGHDHLQTHYKHFSWKHN